jgi:hypothetical protein
MKLQLDSLQKIKNYIHIAQGAVLTLALILTIAIFTRDGTNTGAVGWYFGLVCHSPPLSQATRY